MKTRVDAQQITFESANFLFKNVQKSFITTIFAASLLLITIQHSVSSESCLSWLFILLFTYSARTAVVFFFNQDQQKAQNSHKWLSRFRLATACCGMAWGLATYFVFPQNNPLLQGFLVLALAGVSAGGLVNLAVDSITAFLFAACLWLFASPAFLTQENQASIHLFVLLALFMIYVGIAGKQLARGLVDSIGLKLTAENKEKEIINLTQRQSLHLEQTPMGVIEWDEHLNVATWNKACTNTFGYTPAYALGKHISFFIPDLIKIPNHEAVEKLISQQSSLKQLCGNLNLARQFMITEIV